MGLRARHQRFYCYTHPNWFASAAADAGSRENLCDEESHWRRALLTYSLPSCALGALIEYLCIGIGCIASALFRCSVRYYCWQLP